MRLLLAALLLAPLSLARSYTSPQSPIQVYLYPAPSGVAHAHTAPTLTPDQAKAVLAHHLGEEIGVFDEIPEDESLWGQFMGVWRHLQGAEELKARPRVVILDGGVSAQDVLPTTLPPSPAFYLDSGKGAKSLLSPYLHRAEDLLDHILDGLPEVLKKFKDTFDMAGTKAAAALGHELSCLTALAESVPWADNAKLSAPWESIRLSGLGRVDRQSEVWETGRQGVRAGLQAMTAPGSPPLLLVIMPSTRRMAARSVPTVATFANSFSSSCFSSNSTCSKGTNCYGRGSCVLLSNSSSSGGECWGCKCVAGYAGSECQKADYTVPFVILVFSTLLLVAMLVGSVMLLFSVGETKLPSTLTLAVGQTKRD